MIRLFSFQIKNQSRYLFSLQGTEQTCRAFHTVTVQKCRTCDFRQVGAFSQSSRFDIRMISSVSVVNSNNNKRIFQQKGLQQPVLTLHKRQFSLEYFVSTEYAPVRLAYNYLITVHEFTGLPWWATIILSTVMLRGLVTLPLYVVSQGTIARYKNVQKDLVEISNTLRAEVFHYSREKNLSNADREWLYKSQMKNQFTKKMIEQNCHPFRAVLVVFVQVPVWVALSCGLRNLCGFSYGDKGNNIYDGFTTGGLQWFTDLTVADPTFILPIILGVSNLFITEMTHLALLNSGITPTGRMKYMQNFLRGISVCMIGFGSMVPSAMCLYWTTSSLFGLIQFILMQQPRIRRAFNIPKVDGESQTPMRDLMKIAKQKYMKKSQ